jgi:hypothetical protein
MQRVNGSIDCHIVDDDDHRYTVVFAIFKETISNVIALTFRMAHEIASIAANED